MELGGASIAVTGATGFIGRYVVRSLLRHGARPVGVVRNPSKVPAMVEAGVELRRADLRDRDALAEAFAGVDAVVANAALVSLGGHAPEAVIAANLEGTRNVIEAAATAGVQRVVFVSSGVAYAPRRPQVYREEDPLRRADGRLHRFNAYAVSKAAAETEAWRLCEARDIALSTVRPYTVYGAFDNGTFTTWLKRFLSLPVTLFPTHLMLAPVYAGDIAEAICAMLERSEVAGGRAYNIAGVPAAHSYWDMMEAWRAAGGRVPHLVLPIPVPLTVQLDIGRAERELHYANRPLVEGMRETFALEAGRGDFAF